MKRRVVASFLLVFIVLIFIPALISSRKTAGNTPLLLDDFEDLDEGNVLESVDFGSGAGSEINVEVSRQIKVSGDKSIKVVYNSVPGGYMWLARGYDLDVKGASKWRKRPEDIKWNKYKTLSFYIYGQGKNTQIAVDLRDAGKEYWRFMIRDDTEGWQKIECSLNEFFARSDWQPEDAVKNGVIDFPLKSFQFEPRTPGEGVIYIDKVELNP